MEKSDPHKTHSYSQDWMIMTALDYEIRNRIKLSEQTNELSIIKQYMENRVKEIKERWK